MLGEMRGCPMPSSAALTDFFSLSRQTFQDLYMARSPLGGDHIPKLLSPIPIGVCFTYTCVWGTLT